ncbi:chromosome partitioning protein ParA [Vibrio sp. SCSIO 43136]|uniref:chromosome partitioning protein ParA n=1 Tax=Vibrio sp. SCSIO 43136 TaxID=2819101 RepID=UPI002074F221|nr:chromosome partitioning protein ParA [Vibrio sp. SCSIO 43136]
MAKGIILLALSVGLLGANLSTVQSASKDKGVVVEKIEKSEELRQLLLDQESIDRQFGVLYERFEHILDRSDSLSGPDENGDGIRDDIEAFIEALEVSTPIRNVIKQNARHFQAHLQYDLSEDSEENRKFAIKLGDEYLKVISCMNYLKIPSREQTNISKVIKALTHNTKVRTKAYIWYNHLQDGSVSFLLPNEERYCEK